MRSFRQAHRCATGLLPCHRYLCARISTDRNATYATGVASEIDQALARVVEVRRMEKAGLQDLLEDWSAPDDAE